MNYNQAIEYIHSTYKFGSKLGLENISKLLYKMGNPHKKLKVIHVAGTNGKGSTCSFISSILEKSNFKVGLFTSPYLEEFNERIRINGKNIPNEDLGEVTGFVKGKIDEILEDGGSHPTEFEVVTAIAFEYYFREKVDFVVLEVGLGGRLDSTNVIEKPLVSVITPIALDHTEYLGNTISKIAYEKAGIIKKNCPVVISNQESLAEKAIADKCRSTNSKLYRADIEKKEITRINLEFTEYKINNEVYKIKVLGLHQVNNSIVAIKVAEVLRDIYEIKISNENIKKGLEGALWPGRFEIMSKSPLIIIDGAHNLHGAIGLSKSLDAYLKGKNLVAVIGILGDKDYNHILENTLKHFDKVIVTEAVNPRALPVNQLLEKVKAFGLDAYGEKNINNAIEKALEIENMDGIIIFGSLYMIGEVRTILKNLK